MKGDFSRHTFVPQRHYRGVLMQQGRVQVDADWNEQQAIQQRLDETTTRDVVGQCGVPEDTLDGYKLSGNGPGLDIGAGRIYVDGILCENDLTVTYNTQPHRPGPPAPSVKGDLEQAKAFSLVGLLAQTDVDQLTKAQLAKLPDHFALAYLDVWQRSVSALDDAHIREKALNGPDTATRTQTIWQVRLLPFPVARLNPVTQQALIDMLLKIGLAGEVIDPSTPTAEDVLALLDVPQGCRGEWPGWANLVKGSTGAMLAKAEAPSGDENNPCLVPAGGGFRRLENQLYRVEIHQGGDEKKATFKWSRENGSVVVRWTGQSGAQNEILEIEGPNPDAVLGFLPGQWVELTDDRYELEGWPGILVRLGQPDGSRLTVDPTSIPSGTVPLRSQFPNNPKIRRWDAGTLGDAIKPERNLSTTDLVELEDGVQIQFKPGTYRSGDYWLIPARTTGGQIEWPGRKGGDIFWPPYPAGVDASFEPHAGIAHHYCPLAVIYMDEGDKVHVVDDCRAIFPPLTGLIDMYYAGGDGQTARADPAGVGLFLPLDLPLRVQVLGSTDPIEGAEIRFRALNGGDLKGNAANLSATPPAQAADITLTTGPDGVAECFWKLFDGDPAQRVEASLVSVPGDQRLIPRAILFHAQLGKASEIAYYPNSGCTNLESAHTVEDALDRLATLTHLAYVGGAGQVGLLMPNQGGARIQLARPLQVQVVSSCGPVANALVTFTASDNGRLSAVDPFPSNAGNTLEVTTGADGMAQCFWQISANSGDGAQFVTAKLSGVPEGSTAAEPLSVEFNASLVVVGEGGGGGCCVSVVPDQMTEAIQALVNSGQLNIEICLQPTRDGKVQPLDLDGSDMHYSLTIRGCGKAFPISWQVWSLSHLRLFRLQDVTLIAAEPPVFKLTNCEEVVIEGCRLINQPGSTEPLIYLIDGQLAHLRKNIFLAPALANPIGPRDILEGLSTLPLGDLFAGRAGERRDQRIQVSQNLATLTAAVRRQFATNLKRKLDLEAARLSPTEMAVYNQLVSVMGQAQANPAVIERTLASVDAVTAAAARGAGSALVLSCPGAQVYIVDNTIAGTLFLYGGASRVFLNIDQTQLLGRRLKEGILALVPEEGALHLRGNDLYGLDGAGEHAQRLLNAAGNGGQIDNLFAAAFIVDNRLYAGLQPDIVPLAVAGHVTLTGNSFDVSAGNLGGSVIANSASYTGNTANPIEPNTPRPSVQLFDASTLNGNNTNQAANPGLNIVAF